MEREILLSLFGFGLGILTTILTQVISRRFRFADARRRRRLGKLERIRAWMEAYRALFRCEYPELDELIFANEYLQMDSPLYNEKTRMRVCEALKKYREANATLEEAERKGHEALTGLGESNFLQRVIFPLEMLLSRSKYVLTPHGFPRVIAPYLSELHEQRYKLFEQFPKWSAKQQIDWDKLDYISPNEVHRLIHSRLYRWTDESKSEAYIVESRHQASETADARDNLKAYRHKAEIAIDSILDKVREYEDRWAIPEPGS